MNYSAYNLTIQSDISLPLPVAPSGDQTDIIITVGEISEPGNLSRTYDGVWYAHGSDSLYLKWDTLGSFLIQGGNTIVLHPYQGQSSSESSIVTPLLGTVMAVAMHQRGMTALHGSSVLLNDKAVIFLGEKGEGKSTMAGYFRKQGCSLISDDICAIDMGEGTPRIHSSFPQIKLWPDAMEYLQYKPEKYTRVHPGFEKRNISLKSDFSYTSSNVAAVIVLATGPDITIERITGPQAIPVLIPHLMINRFPEHQPETIVRTLFFQLVRLIKNSSVYQLTRPREISLLPEVSDVVRDNL